MPARPSSRDAQRRRRPCGASIAFPVAAPSGAPRTARLIRPSGLAVLLSCTAAFLITGLERSPVLPSCDSGAVSARLAERLDDIPALAGRQATLIGIDDVRRRGHAGSRPLRACQGRLVTSAGEGAIEYSIRAGEGGGFSVRPELFQGGWRTRLLGSPERAGS